MFSRGNDNQFSMTDFRKRINIFTKEKPKKPEAVLTDIFKEKGISKEILETAGVVNIQPFIDLNNKLKDMETVPVNLKSSFVDLSVELSKLNPSSLSGDVLKDLINQTETFIVSNSNKEINPRSKVLNQVKRLNSKI